MFIDKEVALLFMQENPLAYNHLKNDLKEDCDVINALKNIENQISSIFFENKAKELDT